MVRTSPLRNPPAKPSRNRVAMSGGGGSEAQARNQGRAGGHGVRGPVASPAPRMVVSSGAEALSLREERRELVCSMIGLTVKIGLVVMAGVSLCRLAGAYQERMERQGELAAVLEIEQAQVAKARDRFDQLFMVAGEQKVIREQSQWIAPNRLRVVWQTKEPLSERPVVALQPATTSPQRP